MNYDLNEIYKMSTFKDTFEKFIQETPFGTSVYGICYDKNLVSGSIKEYILKMKYSKEPLQDIAITYVPPTKMIELRNLVEKYTPEMYDNIHKEDA